MYLDHYTDDYIRVRKDNQIEPKISVSLYIDNRNRDKNGCNYNCPVEIGEVCGRLRLLFTFAIEKPQYKKDMKKQTPRQCDYEALCEKINRGNVGFFFGAGTSFNSGIPTVTYIINKLLSSLNLHTEAYQFLRKAEYPFEAFMEIVEKYDNINRLLGVFEEGTPSLFHRTIKKLVNDGYISQLMSTNFDLMIERVKIKDINVVCKERDFGKLQPNQVNYIKIHGSIDEPKSIRTVMSSIASRSLRTKRKSAIDFFFNRTKLNTIFVLGYSCSDKMDLTPYIKSSANKSVQVVFIEHCNGPEFSVNNVCDNNKVYELFSEYDLLYVKCNTDDFIEHLANHFGVENSKECVLEKKNVDSFFDYSQLSKDSKFLIGAYLLFRNSEFELSLKLLKEIVDTRSFSYMRAEAISLLLEVLHNIEEKGEKDWISGYDFESLLELRDEARVCYMSENDEKTKKNKLAELYTHWGHVLLSMKKFDDAILEYEKAFKLFEETRNVYRSYQCRNNIANVLWKRREWQIEHHIFDHSDKAVFEECDKIWMKCLNYYRKSAYIFEYEIECVNMAELLLTAKPNQKKRIKKYIDTAHDIAIYINDIMGVKYCNALRRKCI